MILVNIQIRIYRGNLENSQKTSINDIRYFAEMKICMTCVIPGNVYFKHFSYYGLYVNTFIRNFFVTLGIDLNIRFLTSNSGFSNHFIIFGVLNIKCQIIKLYKKDEILCTLIQNIGILSKSMRIFSFWVKDLGSKISQKFWEEPAVGIVILDIAFPHFNVIFDKLNWIWKQSFITI